MSHHRFRSLSLVVAFVGVVASSTIGCSSNDGGDPSIKQQCLAGCDADRTTCEDGCVLSDQATCNNECPAVADSCSSVHCVEFASGGQLAADCDAACNGLAGACFGSCPQAAGCRDACTATVDSCILTDCAPYAPGSQAAATCIIGCVQAGGACLQACHVDDSCTAGCADGHDSCVASCS